MGHMLGRFLKFWKKQTKKKIPIFMIFFVFVTTGPYGANISKFLLQMTAESFRFLTIFF